MNISVIIPAYNEEKYISHTLVSLQNQTRKPDEVIVVDGSSTDATVAIAKQYNANVLILPKRGVGFARQKGLEASHGDIIACTDADTVVPKNWLKNIENTFIHKPKIVGLYGDYRIQDGWWLYRFGVNVMNPILFRILPLFGIPTAIGQNIAFRRAIAIKIGGFPINFQSAEDHEIIKRLTKAGTVLYQKNICVISSGRRGREGFRMIPRKIGGMLRYYLTGKADTFTFPDIR